MLYPSYGPYYFKTMPTSGHKKQIAWSNNKMKKKVNFQPTTLNGFDKILSPGISKIRRLVWFILIIILVIFSGFQIYKCFHNFLHQHTAVTVEYINNATIKAPCIIICPLILSRNVKLISHFRPEDENKTKISPDDLFNLVTSSTTVEDIWEVSDMIAEDLQLQVIEGLSLVDSWFIDNFALEAKKINGLSGKCTQINAKRDIVYNGLYTFIRIRNIQDLPYKEGTFLQVSVQTDSLSHANRLFVARQGVIFPLHAQVNLYYTLQELEYLNTKQIPCSTEEEISICLNKCIYKVMYEEENTKCRLPFMDLKEDLPLCATPEEFRSTFEIADRLMKNYSLNFCNCPRQCHTVQYQMKSASELHIDDDIVLNLHIFFSDNSIQRIIEYNSYGITALLSDVGGTLGLYLGVCLITVIEIIEIIIFKLVNAMNFKHNKNM